MMRNSARLLRVAVVQMAPDLFEKTRNVRKVLEMMEKAARSGAKLVAFPEVSLSGYMLNDLTEITYVAEAIPSSITNEIVAKCNELNIYVVVGMIEKYQTGIYNSAVLAGPQGIIGKHRKVFLPPLGADKLLSKGNMPFTAYQTEIGKIGLIICAELEFPEHARVLALQGSEILVFLAALVPGLEIVFDVARVRAHENRMNLLGSFRVGAERGAKYLGRSMIIEHTGEILAQASSDIEEIVYSTLDFSEREADAKKRFFLKTGRRPEFYDLISKTRMASSLEP